MPSATPRAPRGAYLAQETMRSAADHRKNQSLGAGVERAGDALVGATRWTHQRRDRARLEILQSALQRIDAESAVLGVEEDVIASAGCEQVADSGRRELPDQRAGLELPVADHVA